MLISFLRLSTHGASCNFNLFKIHCGRFNYFHHNNIRKHIFRNFKFTKPTEKTLKDSNLTLKLFISTSGICLVKLISDNHTVLCQSAKSRAVGYPDQNALVHKEPQFEWKQFLQLLLPEIWSLIGAVSAALLVAFINIQLPLYLGNIINILAKFTQDSTAQLSFMSEMKEPALKLVGLYVAQSVFTCVYISLLSGLGERIAAKLRCQLFESILKQDIAFFDSTRTGELVDRLTTDVQEFKSSFKLVVSQGLRNGAQVIGAVSSLLIISPSLTLGMLGIVPIVIISGTFIGSLLRSLSREAQNQAAKAVTIGEEAISNIRTVRAFAMEPYEVRLFTDQVSLSCSLQERLGVGVGMFQAGTNLFLNGMVLGTLYFGGHLMASNTLTAGDLMSFLVSTQMIQRSMAQMSLLFGSYIKGLSSGARIFQLINLKPHISSEGGQILPTENLVPEVQFNDVTFAYPTRPSQTILKDFNLRIPAGQKVAIVGSSGNGKSTIVALLERFYDVSSGNITISGVDLKHLDGTWLRGNVIGLINQEPVLFATSVRENIRYGDSSVSDEQVEEAAKLANAHGFISEFPSGYDTVVGERGVTISGGQKQRIAIARALLKNPQILILDEATSALDNESEKLVQAALESACKGRTVLMIAHRLSTVQNADLIVVLQAGQIVEMGNHKSLLAKKGHYWTLMNQQNP
ncbi:hypothetical protein M8J77_001089 [Diaphorina citri]|nr:hypothetical protein M8J77_001089 [Diaphorina citri]